RPMQHVPTAGCESIIAAAWDVALLHARYAQPRISTQNLNPESQPRISTQNLNPESQPGISAQNLSPESQPGISTRNLACGGLMPFLPVWSSATWHANSVDTFIFQRPLGALAAAILSGVLVFKRSDALTGAYHQFLQVFARKPAKAVSRSAM